MPVYEFTCLKCEHSFQITTSIADYEKQAKKRFRCPKCHSTKVEQVISTVMVETSKKS